MPGKYNPEKPVPKVKFLEPPSHPSVAKFRTTFELNGVEFVTSTPIRNLPAKTDYHCLKPSTNIKKHPAKKVPKSSTYSPRIRKILNNILTKPQPTPVKPQCFKKEVRKLIPFKRRLCAHSGSPGGRAPRTPGEAPESSSHSNRGAHH